MFYVLACHRDGRSASELALELFGDAARTVTVRAEMSRLRRHFGGRGDRAPGGGTLPVRADPPARRARRARSGRQGNPRCTRAFPCALVVQLELADALLTEKSDVDAALATVLRSRKLAEETHSR
jgi:hypothetical protein